MHILNQFAEFAGAALVAGVWQGLVLAAAVWLCLQLVPRMSAAVRYAVWASVLVVIALLPFVEVLRPRGAGAGPGSMVAVDLRWSLAVALGWAALSLFRASNLVVHGLRLWSLGRRASLVTPGERSAALLAGGDRPVVLCTSTEIDRPSVIGFLAPRILVPAWLFAQLTEVELEQIILHEMEHLRRRDDWMNLLQKLSLVLLPLNPILLWVERRLCLERELACDDGVLRRTNAPKAYATCLTNLAERGLDRRVLALALGALERQSQLAQRVQRILRREAVLTPVQSRMGVTAMAVVLVAGAAGLARCPQLVSFVAPPQHLAALTPEPSATVLPAAQTNLVSARNRSADRVERVSYTGRTSTAATMQLAVLKTSTGGKPERPRARRTVTPVVHREIKPRVRQVSQVDQVERGWIMLAADWSNRDHQRSNETPASAIVPVALSTSSYHPYAALRVEGGWLIVQL